MFLTFPEPAKCCKERRIKKIHKIDIKTSSTNARLTVIARFLHSSVAVRKQNSNKTLKHEQVKERKKKLPSIPNEKKK